MTENSVIKKELSERNLIPVPVYCTWSHTQLFVINFFSFWHFLPFFHKPMLFFFLISPSYLRCSSLTICLFFLTYYILEIKYWNCSDSFLITIVYYA